MAASSLVPSLQHRFQAEEPVPQSVVYPGASSASAVLGTTLLTLPVGWQLWG